MENEECFFRFGGGLIDFDISSRLVGSFDILIAENGSASVTRFDVFLDDLFNSGSYDIGWRDGDSLADRMWQDPLQLSGQRSVDQGQEKIDLSVTEDSYGSTFLKTTFRLNHIDSMVASLTLNTRHLQSISDSVFDIPVLDSPSMRTRSFPRWIEYDEPVTKNGLTLYGEYIPGPQLLVQLVPEPTNFALICSLLLALPNRFLRYHA